MEKTKNVRVDIHQPEMIPVERVVQCVFEVAGLKPVMTSGTDGKHSENSYHYSGYARDFRSYYWLLSKKRRQIITDEIRRQLREISPYYDVVLEKTHIHVEFDLRRAESNKI